MYSLHPLHILFCLFLSFWAVFWDGREKRGTCLPGYDIIVIGTTRHDFPHGDGSKLWCRQIYFLSLFCAEFVKHLDFTTRLPYVFLFCQVLRLSVCLTFCGPVTSPHLAIKIQPTNVEPIVRMDVCCSLACEGVWNVPYGRRCVCAWKGERDLTDDNGCVGIVRCVSIEIGCIDYGGPSSRTVAMEPKCVTRLGIYSPNRILTRYDHISPRVGGIFKIYGTRIPSRLTPWAITSSISPY